MGMLPDGREMLLPAQPSVVDHKLSDTGAPQPRDMAVDERPLADFDQRLDLLVLLFFLFILGCAPTKDFADVEGDRLGAD